MAVRVEGVPHATAAYAGIADDARDMRDPNRAIAETGARAARARAPHRTGALGASIEANATEREAVLSVAVPYARFQEYGTRYVRARRFMAAGREAMRETAPDAYRARMAAIVERRAR